MPSTLSTPPTSDTRPPVNAEVDRLTTYAMQSPGSRQAALNEFIFRNLEDDSFITLLEDMETCWARSGLGMK